MNCAEFDGALCALLEGEGQPGEREAGLTGLRAHARDCADCRGLSDLLELLALRSADRDLVEAPSDAYWNKLEQALGRRLRAGAGAGRRWMAWTGVAAALLLAAIGSWLLLRPGQDGVSKVAVAAPGGGREEIPGALEALLRSAEPEQALAGLDFLGGLAGVPAAPARADDRAGESADEDLGGLFLLDPETLDAEARSALLEWLREGTIRGRGVES